MAFPTGWTLLQTCTIDNTKVSGSANLTNFPVLLNEDNILANTFSNTQGQEINTNYLLNDANLQGYWRLESDGTDSSGNSYTLTTSAAPDYVAAKFGNGGDFEYSSHEYLSIANASCANLEISGSQTWSVWVKPESLVGNSNIMCKRGAGTFKRMYLDGSYRPKFDLQGLTGDDQVESDTPVVAGNWYHIVGVYNSSATTHSIFVNGVKMKEVTASGSATDTDGDFAVGKDTTYADSYNFDGIIDDAAIWDRALTDAEVLGLYAGGADVRFSSDSAGSTQLAHEVVSYSTEDSTAEIWVKIPTVSYNADTVFYMWGDNATATPQARDLATYGSEAVWDSNYKLVLHGNNGLDATSNSNDVATNSGVTYVAGKVGQGFEFDAGDHLIVTDSATLDFTSAITMEAWVNPDSLATNHRIIIAKDDNFLNVANNTYGIMLLNTSGNWYAGVTDTSNNEGAVNDGAMSINNWHLGAYAWDTTNKFAVVDGTATDTSTDSVAAIRTNADNLWIGENNNGVTPYSFDGTLDEIRLSNIKRTAGWLVTGHNNQNAPSTFITGATPAITEVYTETIAIAESLLKSTQRTISETITVVETFLKNIQRTLSEALSVIDDISIQKVIKKVLSEAITITESFKKGFALVLEDTLVLVEGFSKTLVRVFTENLSISEIFRRLLNGVRVRWNRVVKTIASWTGITKPTSTWTKEEETTADWDKDGKPDFS